MKALLCVNSVKSSHPSCEDLQIISDDNDLQKLVSKYGIRYVIRNFMLCDNFIDKIVNNEFSDIEDEKDITKNEIISFQKSLTLRSQSSHSKLLHSKSSQSKSSSISCENLKIINEDDLQKLVNKYGIRYVIRNFVLCDASIDKIVNNEFSDIEDEKDITKNEIVSFQKLLTSQSKSLHY
jgi:hypothetical protein